MGNRKIIEIAVKAVAVGVIGIGSLVALGYDPTGVPVWSRVSLSVAVGAIGWVVLETILRSMR